VTGETTFINATVCSFFWFIKKSRYLWFVHGSIFLLVFILATLILHPINNSERFFSAREPPGGCPILL
jgi:hypothetical protein